MLLVFGASALVPCTARADGFAPVFDTEITGGFDCTDFAALSSLSPHESSGACTDFNGNTHGGSAFSSTRSLGAAASLTAVLGTPSTVADADVLQNFHFEDSVSSGGRAAELLLEFGIDGSATITGAPGVAGAELRLDDYSTSTVRTLLDFSHDFDSSGDVSLLVTSDAVDMETSQDIRLLTTLKVVIVQGAPGVTTIDFAHTAKLARIDLIDPSTGMPLTGVSVTDGLGDPIPLNQDLLGTVPEPGSGWLFASAVLAGLGYKFRRCRPKLMIRPE